MITLAEVAAEAAVCRRCRLAEGRTNVVFGMGDPEADLMFVGEAPGAEEDRQGLPFVGRSGRLLDRLMLEEIGITRESCYIGNVIRCRPPGNRDPLPDEVASCRRFLDAQLGLISPRVVVTLGRFAAQTLLDTTEGVSRLRGRVYPLGSGVVVPTYHPAYVLRGGAIVLAEMRADFVRAKQVLASAGAPSNASLSQPR